MHQVKLPQLTKNEKSIIFPNKENIDLYLAWRLWAQTAIYK